MELFPTGVYAGGGLIGGSPALEGAYPDAPKGAGPPASELPDEGGMLPPGIEYPVGPLAAIPLVP